jgi:small-conductance mechanosensitive channel
MMSGGWQDDVVRYGLRFALALLLILAGLWLARRLARAVQSRLLARRIDRLLADFVATAISAVGAIVIVLAAFQMTGIPTGSFLAVLGTAGLAVGLALKDSLAQLASGVMLIVLRPFHAGEAVTAAGQEGTVESVHLFQTVLRTADNRLVTLPNSSITAQPIVNASRCATRRADLNLWISPETPVAEAVEALKRQAGADARILRDPAPYVAAGDLGERGLLLVVQVWAKAAELGGVKSDLIERVQGALDAIGARPIGPAQPQLRWLEPPPARERGG